MYKIVKKEILAKDIKLIGVEAPHITYNAKAGNFVVVIVDEKGERVPLTIYDWDKERGIVYIIFMEVGTSTKKLGLLNEGDYLYAIAGPFGKHFNIQNYGNVVIIGGGVGTPAIFPIARDLKKSGNKVLSIMGFRTKELVILEKEMKSVSDKVIIATNDGSYGKKGLVTDALQELIYEKEKIDLVIAIGPVIMMKAVSDLTKIYNLKTIVSLNAIMIDATGMCGGCRVTVGGEIKFSCVDGPDFDGHLVDFDQLLLRLSAYKDKEQESLTYCRLNKKIEENKNV
ncbi:MAG: sulfide/dihydroorotate dehydrogenase-like FAD/NAD-binding protein [Candidatus Goldbacteria bacterium]|nr:sulfide/dihydroorotate dehydrogenase-like FAD/NAD-binding protein [Candidatus Goldiibacteriota bacterium]